MANNELQFDLLIVDDDPRWREVILASIEDIYTYAVSGSYEEAIQNLEKYRYKIVSVNLKIMKRNCLSQANGRKLLLFLRKYYPDLPVILISGFIIGNPNKYIEEYPNIKQILIKGESEDFVEHLESSLIEIYASVKDKKNTITNEPTKIETIKRIDANGNVEGSVLIAGNGNTVQL